MKYFILAISFTAIFISCQTESSKDNNSRVKYVIPDSLLKSIAIDTVKTCPLVNAIALTGSVDFDQEHQINIFPMVSGVIQDVKVQLGDYVCAGQVLAVVKSSEMASYSNNLVIAETNVQTTKRKLDAATDLFKSGLSSQIEVTNSQSNYEQALSQLEMAKRILKINGNNTQGDYIIKAPISGFIVQKNITNNTSLRSDNANNIFTISDLKKVWVNANVYESNINSIHLGDQVNITALSYPNRIFKGKIDKIINVLDPTSKVMKVRIVINNDDFALKPLMFASITVLNKRNEESLCVSSGALVFDHSLYYVLKYNGKGDADIIPVKVKSNFGDKVYLSDGVKEGDQLIASQASMIYDNLNN